MSSAHVTPWMLRRELAHLLHRSVFADLAEAESAISAERVYGGDVHLRCKHGATVLASQVPNNVLTYSLDSLSELYLRPMAQELIDVVWRGD